MRQEAERKLLASFFTRPVTATAGLFVVCWGQHPIFLQHGGLHTMRNKPYRWLAEYYDELFEPARFPIDAARRRVLGRIMPSVTSACDLACGTGTTALKMARRGIEVFAVDISPTMCHLTRAKARRSSLPVRVLRADMREFRLPHPVDLVTCEFDALNHLPQKRDLTRVAMTVARALKPGGYFFFDVNNRAGFRRYWSHTRWMQHRRAVMVMRAGQDSSHDRAWCDVEWFIREGALWRHRHERVEEVCWNSPEIRRALATAGFYQVRTWDAAPFFKDNSLIAAGCRTVYLALKKPV